MLLIVVVEVTLWRRCMCIGAVVVSGEHGAEMGKIKSVEETTLRRDGDWRGLSRVVANRFFTGLESFFHNETEFEGVIGKEPDGEGEGGANIGEGRVDIVW